MKKNFLTAAAIMVTAFFVATTIAQAADVTFSGQLRPRFEVNGQSDFNQATDAEDFVSTRVRLNANVNVNDSTSAFIQLQSVRTWGNDLDGAGQGSGNGSFTGSDGDASVGLHQAYFTLKNFATLPVDLQFGRQEVVIDGHRLFGNTGWTQGAQTHDAVRLTHKHGDHTLTYAYAIGHEDALGGSNNDDVEVHLLNANIQGILGGNLSIIAAAVQDGCGNTTTSVINGACSNFENDIYTIGFRQAGQLYGIDYRGEYYYQGGQARADSLLLPLGHTAGNSIDRDAYMFGLRIGKKFNNVTMKPSLTVWYDQLSGTEDSDVSGNDYGTFNTLFDTGHKFYGLMDLLSGAGNGTSGLGLTDLAIKASIQPMDKWTLKADYHWFGSEVDPSSNATVRAGVNAGTPAIGANTDEDIGQELDVTLVHKYNANTVISAGYSVFNTEQLYDELNSARGHTAQWAYLQFDVKF